MRKPKLTRLQRELLGHLCLDTWDRPPSHVTTATIVSCLDRKLIRTRGMRGRYRRGKYQLTDEGHRLYCDFIEWELEHASKSSQPR